MKEILQKMFKFQLARNLTEKFCRTLCMNENNAYFFRIIYYNKAQNVTKKLV